MSSEERKVPELRFKGFNDDWEQRELNDLVEFSKGKFYSKSDLVENGNDVILYGQLYTNYQTEISYSDTKVIPKPNSVYSKGKEVIIPSSGESAEDISIASSLTVGGIIIAGDINILTPFNILNNTFLALDLSNGKSKKELSKYAQGKSIVHLHGNDFKKLKLKFPILNEQIKIKEFILRIEILINLHQRKINILTELKKEYLKEMFANNMNKTPNLRLDSFRNEWEQYQVGEIFNIYDNLRVPVKASDRKSGNTPYYGANGVQDYIEGYTHKGEFVLLAEDGANDLDNYPVHYVNGEVWVNNHAHVLQGKTEFIDNKFAVYLLMNSNIRKFLVGGGRAKLNANIMMQILVDIPKLSEQILIGQLFYQIEKNIHLHQRKLNKLEKLKSSYLQKMFL